MASTKRNPLHALAIPVPGQGHINPLMRFCKRLASQENFTITFVDIEVLLKSELELNKQEHGSTVHANTEDLSKQKHESIDAINTPPSNQDHTSIHANTSSPVAAQAHKKLDIRRAHIPMEVRIDKGSSILESFFGACQSLVPPIEELLSKLIHEDPPITCLISDLYMTGSTQKVADKFNIPRIAFHTASQSVLLFTNYILEGTVSLEEVIKVVESKEGLKEDTFVKGLPGLPALVNGDIMDYLDGNRFMHSLNVQTLKESKERAHAIVVNSIEELEGPALKVDFGGIPIYAVGPLIEPLDKESSISCLWKEDKECIVWLNQQPCHSVLYISFGSIASLSKAQFDEILAGLISSQQRFLWVFRPNLVEDASYSTFPIDLLSKTQGKGYSIEWAPQLSVLSHPSVGGFLTHCGWNSTVEAISLGVPMLCFPYFSDQFICAKFITQEWKVGLPFKMAKESGLIERDEVERGIMTLMVEEEGKLLRQNANYFKDVSSKNLLLEGKSAKNIQALVHSLIR